MTNQPYRPPEYQGPPQYQPGQPPQSPAPTYMNTYHTTQPDPNTEKAKADFFNVAKWGVWMWIGMTALPVLAILGCCGLCMFGGVIGAANTPDISITPTP